MAAYTENTSEDHPILIRGIDNHEKQNNGHQMPSESFSSPLSPLEHRKKTSTASSRRNSTANDKIRRSSLTTSLQVPKRQQAQKGHDQTPTKQHRHQSDPQPSQRRKWSKYRNTETFDFDPLNGPSTFSAHVPARSSSSSSKSGSTTANDTESKESPRYASQTSNGVLTMNNNDEAERERIKEVGQLASIFLEIRRNIMTDCNIDLSHNEHLDLERDKNIPGQMRLKNISRSTVQRAEKVKMMLNLFYFFIFNSQRNSNPKYEGVDGVYNPLQVIRNRKIRKKYHQPPKLAIKTLPYASTVLSRSKHNLLWQIDLTELTYDFNWRAQHWHELINPFGDLWFPYENGNVPDKHHHRRHHRRHRPHLHHRHSSDNYQIDDQLFEMDNEKKNGIEINEDEFCNSNNSNSSKDDDGDIKSRKRDQIASKIGIGSKSPFMKKGQINSREQLSDGIEFEREKSRADLSKLSKTESYNGSFKGSFLNDISIKPIKNQRITSPSSTDLSGRMNQGITNDATTSSSMSNDSKDPELEELKVLNCYLNKLRRLDVLMNFGEHHLTVKEREYSYIIDFQKILKESEEIRSTSKYLKQSVLTKYEHLLIDRTKRLEDYQNELTNNYSPRVDKLLLLSDRTIGEVNTTLSLEVRKLSERLEKLGPSYKRVGAFVNFAYWLLENSIVLLLWTIWIGFSIGRIIKFFFMLFWRVIKWVIA